MTNKEWLDSLSSKDFAEWCCGLDAIDYKTGKPIGIYPHLETIKRSYTSSQGGLEQWLEEKTLYRGPEELNFDKEYDRLKCRLYDIKENDATLDDLTKYLETISGAKNFWEFLEQAFNKLSDYEKDRIICSIWGSDIEMFTPAFKKFVIGIIHSSDKSLSNAMKSMYDVYKSEFDKIESVGVKQDEI